MSIFYRVTVYSINNMYSIGLDIGTSNISAVLIDKDKNSILTENAKNDSTIEGQYFEALQDPTSLFFTAKNLIDKIVLNTDIHTIQGIGIANQMHGIVYVDKTAKALSPLYTWQDKRGDEAYNKDYSFSEYVSMHTGFQVPTGYGLLTHYYNLQKNLVPPNTAYILDIGNFVVAQLLSCFNTNNALTDTQDRQRAFSIHTSNAHSWGFFDTTTQNFDKNTLHTLGIDTSIIPNISHTSIPLGTYQGIAVYPALGDNQAGVLGSIGINTKAVLINIGTSAQLSFINNSTSFTANTSIWEIRPFIQKNMLYVASSLCGGKTLDIWTHFIAHAIHTIQYPTENIENIQQSVYAFLTSLTIDHNHTQEKSQKTSTPVTVNPHFYGTRHEPNTRASITQLSSDNFNIHSISIAMIQGMVDELLAFWEKVPSSIQSSKDTLFLTGKSMQIPLLQQLLKKAFSPLKLCLLEHTEHTAIGAALWAQ